MTPDYRDCIFTTSYLYHRSISAMPGFAEHISDYIGSEQFFFLDPSLKEYAEQLLGYLCERISEPLTHASVEHALNGCARLDLPFSIRREVPLLLEAFFDFLASSGRLPEVGQWSEYVRLYASTYRSQFRQDGSVKGVTFKKKYTDVGRNDPCPCGSGKKFKKCCRGLLE